MPRERDTQFARFWRAQSVINPFDKQFKTEKGLNSYVERACGRAFLLRRYPCLKLRVGVRHLRGRDREFGGYWSVGIPITSRNLRTVIYVLARTIWMRTDDLRRAHYGWQFVAIYIDVVHALMGKAEADLLRESCKSYGVRWKPKKKVTVTPEMIERLAAARQKRKENVDGAQG